MIKRSISHFDPEAIAQSGQCFRMTVTAPGQVEVIHRGRHLVIHSLGGDAFGFDCTEKEFEAVWEEYFDFSCDYGTYLASVPQEDAYLGQAASAGRGLRILKQDPWEVLVSFILSQRKSIPAIRDGVEKLCRRFGTRLDIPGKEAYAFPAPAALAGASINDLCACSLGYRAPYILAAARSVAMGETDLQALCALSDAQLLQRLLTLYGVGVKVASCVMLFGYHRMDTAPVDVWIQRVIDAEYGGVSPFPRYKGFAGIMQQYMFYHQTAVKRGRRPA